MIIIIKAKGKLASAFMLALTLLFLILIISMPEYFKESTVRAVTVCLNSVIPSLFCFIVLTKIIVSSGLAYVISKPFGLIFYKLTGLPPFCGGVYLLSFLSGFPAGAIAAVDLYKNSAITKSDTERLTALSNNTGPALPVLLIGIGMFKSARIGCVIYVIQIIASLFCALLFCKRQVSGYEPRYPEMRSNVFRAVTDSVEGTVKSTALLCAYVVLFSCVLDALSLLPISSHIFEYIKPFVEIVSGSHAAAGTENTGAFIAVCGALSFGGLCVHMQTAAVCMPHMISMREHFKCKFTQALLAMILASAYVIFI